MFVLKKSDSYFWPVIVKTPVTGGNVKEETFEAEFKRVSQTRIKEIRDLIMKEEITDTDLAREIVVGWKGINDGSAEMEFSKENLESVLDVPQLAASIIKAWFQSISGEAARRKN